MKITVKSINLLGWQELVKTSLRDLKAEFLSALQLLYQEVFTYMKHPFMLGTQIDQAPTK